MVRIYRLKARLAAFVVNGTHSIQEVTQLFSQQ